MDRATHDTTPAESAADSGTGDERLSRRARRERFARRVWVPAELHPVASLNRIDYADAYRAPSVPRDHSAEATRPERGRTGWSWRPSSASTPRRAAASGACSPRSTASSQRED